MPFVGTYNCEQCPKVRGERNHWWVITYRKLKSGPTVFSFREMLADEKPAKDSRYLCSKECVDNEITAFVQGIIQRRVAAAAPAPAGEERTQ
jgi:hypothetical protein